MKNGKYTIFDTAVRGIRFFGTAVILIEIITYSFSFLVSGLVKKDIFNVIEGKEVTLGISSVTVLILLNVTAPLVINCIKQINAGFVAKLGVRLNRNVKSELLKEVLGTKLGNKKLPSEGVLTSLFRNECEDVADFFLTFYYQLPKIALSLAILFILFYINPIFAVVSLIPTVLMTALLKYLSRHIVRNRESARNATGDLTGFLENVFQNIEYYKLISDKDQVCRAFHDKCKRRSASEIKDRVLDKTLSTFSENSSNMVLGIILLIAIPLFKKGVFTIGEFVMFEYYYAFLAMLPGALGAIVRKRKQTEVAVKRLQAARPQEEPACGSARYVGGLLEISVAASGQAGRICANAGQVILIREEKNQSGSMLLEKMFQICKDSLPHVTLRYVPREPVLFDESVRENICMGAPYDAESFSAVLEQTDLLQDVSAFEDGFLKNVGKSGTAISGGQRKRIGIARVLYAVPDILLIDGFTDQVDRQTEETMIARILKSFHGIVFIVSNSEKIEGIADQVIGGGGFLDLPAGR